MGHFKRKSKEEFKKFYSKELLPILNTMEAERQSIQKHKSRLNLFFGFLIGAVFLFFFVINGSDISLLVIVFIGVAWHEKMKDNPRKDSWQQAYKNDVVRSLLQFIDSKITYEPTKGISEKMYTNSQLFTKQLDRFSSEDLVIGKLENIHYQFSEVQGEYEVKRGDSVEWKTDFEGVLMQIDFNKNFKGHYILKRDVADSGFFGKILSKLERFDRIQLESPQFEKLFDLRGTDQVEGRYIFSTSFMKRVVQLQNALKTEIQMAFFDNHLLIALPKKIDLYDHNMYLESAYYGPLFKSFILTQNYIQVIDMLDLNNDIWKDLTEG